MVVTAVFGAGWLFTITMLEAATLPTLVMVPLKPISPPGIPFVPGQDLVRARRGVVSTGQVALALVVTVCKHRSAERGVGIDVIEQTLVGTGSVPLKLAP